MILRESRSVEEAGSTIEMFLCYSLDEEDIDVFYKGYWSERAENIVRGGGS